MSTSETIWEPLPTYYQAFRGAYDYFTLSLNSPETKENTLQNNLPILEYCKFSKFDVIVLITIAILWTYIRHKASVNIFKPLGKYFELNASSQNKMPESAWKFLYYTSIWLTTVYIIVLKGSYTFFQRPSEVWKDWNLEEPVPWDIYFIYMIQGSFYIHSIYATIILDVWRKDSPVMLTHHFVTLALILFSYVLRYHKVGSLILLLHDICDILLEFAKLNVYFKFQGGKEKELAGFLANLSFGLFAVTWFITRLYWYPLKALYTTGAVVVAKKIVLPYGPLMNLLLWTLQLLHAYWFFMIIDFLLRVFTGQIKEIDDTREYDVAKRQIELLEKEAKSQTNGLSKNGVSKQTEILQLNGLTQRTPTQHEPTTDH